MLEHEEGVQNESAELKWLKYDEALTKVGGAGLYFNIWIIVNDYQIFYRIPHFSPVFFFIEPTVDCKNNMECINQCTSESLDDKCLTYIQNLWLVNHQIQLLMLYYLVKKFYNPFAMNYSLIAIGIFLLGFGGNPSITVNQSFINEHSCYFRGIQNVGVQVFFALGEFTIITLAYFITQWRWLGISVALPTILLNFCNFLIFEFPQFLYSKNKKKCVKVLNQIAKINSTQSLEMNELASNPQSKENNSRVYTIWDLLKYKSLRYVFFAGVIMFFAIQVTYYGISFVSDQLGLDFFLMNFIIAFFELLVFLYYQIKQKEEHYKCFFIVGVMSLYFTFKSDHIVFRIFQGVLAELMRFLICVVWALSYVYVSELYPSVVRFLALCLISVDG